MPTPAIPPLVEMGLGQAIAYLQAEERKRTLRVRRWQEDVFRSYREQLRRESLAYLIVKSPADPTLVWDPLAAARADFLAQTTHSYTALTDRVDEATATEMADDLDDLYVEGHNRTAWLLLLGGLPADEALRYRQDVPSASRRAELLLAIGIGGLSWRDRLRAHTTTAQSRFATWMRSSVAGQRTMDETFDGAARLHAAYIGQVTGLLANEGNRAYNTGGALLTQQVMQRLSLLEVWITKQDALVCPLCASLHMTVTPLQPITDSHPGCRCRKVPVLLEPPDSGRRVRYDDFIQEML